MFLRLKVLLFFFGLLVIHLLAVFIRMRRGHTFRPFEIIWLKSVINFFFWVIPVFWALLPCTQINGQVLVSASCLYSVGFVGIELRDALHIDTRMHSHTQHVTKPSFEVTLVLQPLAWDLKQLLPFSTLCFRFFQCANVWLSLWFRCRASMLFTSFA